MEHFDRELFIGRRLQNRAPSPELSLFYAGYKECQPGHAHYGVRDHFLIHYIIKGRGEFRFKNRDYRLAGGDGFVMFPNRAAEYRADAQEPWTYIWIGFHGSQVQAYLTAMGLTLGSPVFHTGNRDGLRRCMSMLLAEDVRSGTMSAGSKWVGVCCSNPEVDQTVGALEKDWGGPWRSCGDPFRFKEKSLMYRFLHILSGELGIRPAKGGNSYVSEAISFMQRNHSSPITMENVAAFIGIERKYLSTLFKSATGKSPKRYLLDYRLATAAGLLKETTLPVYAVAHSVGFTDEFYFTRLFREKYGTPPSSFRRL